MSEEQLPPAAETEAQSQQQQQHAAAEDDAALSNRLFDQLRTQVEFYFSLNNLARDTYLRNMLTAEHPEMPTPRPAQLMCPVGVVTNFPKVRDICARFGLRQDGSRQELAKPPALLLAKALEGSSVVMLSSDGNWIGPALQQLPPPMMGGALTMGGPPAHHFQQPHHFQQQQVPHSFQQGPMGSYPQQQPNHMPMMIPPGAVAMQYQPGGMPLPYPPSSHGGHYPNVNAAPIISVGGSESPSSGSLESMPSQQQQQQALAQQQGNTNDIVFVAVMDLPSETVNPMEILSVFTTESILPKSTFLDHGNTNLWFVGFGSEADAKAAILASSERTIGGMPVHAKLKSELPASSTASLSSMSAPGQMVQQQPQPFPLMGQPGVAYPLLPQGPSPTPPGMATPPPMGTAQNIMPAGYSPYAMPMQQIQQPPQLAGMPPGQPYPPHQMYYNLQQQMHQQLYPGSYMPQQQQGGLQQQMQPQMQPYPPQMGNRFGVVPPPPPPPRASYPGGPPPPYPYQGMHQQYMDGYGGQHYQQYGHMHPPPRQYNDRRQGGPGGAGEGGGFHEPHGQKGHTKKKKKNQQQNRRDSYGSPSNDNGFQRSHDNSPSPIQGDHHRGKWKSKSEQHGDQQSSFRQKYGNASPSFNKHYNRHHHSDRLSGSDTTPSQSSSNRQANKADERDFLSSSDFPGLGGLGGDDKSEKSSQQGDNKSNNNGDGNNKQQLVGYASALLKKKEAEEKKKEAADTAPATVATTDNHEVDSITRQTEEMEREILSEFHDLSLIGDGNNTDVASSSPSPVKANNPQAATGDKTEGSQTVGTASSSTIDAIARSLPNTNNLPILPAGPFPENDVSDIVSEATYSSDSPRQQHPQPAIDVTNSQDFPSRESINVVDDGAVVPPSKEQTPPPPAVSNDDLVMQVVEKPKPPGVWGSKRFADVI